MMMKAISLWQPWASAIALGLKTIETRSWQTWYEGPIAIHAAKTKVDTESGESLHEVFDELLDDHMKIRFAFTDALELDFDCFPFGKIVATAELQECVRTEMIKPLSPVERALGNYSPGRWGWIIRNVKRLDNPIPAIGRQGLFNVEFPK